MGISPVFGVSLQEGLFVWVWDLWMPSSLGGVLQPKFVEDAAWDGIFWDFDFFGSLIVWVWVFCGGLCGGLVSAGLLLCLFVGMIAF